MGATLKRHGWSFAEDRHFKELAASSKPLEEIAGIMKRRTISVRRRATRLGLSIRSSHPPKWVSGRKNSAP
jgi:hypothetical protein